MSILQLPKVNTSHTDWFLWLQHRLHIDVRAEYSSIRTRIPWPPNLQSINYVEYLYVNISMLRYEVMPDLLSRHKSPTPSQLHSFHFPTVRKGMQCGVYLLIGTVYWSLWTASSCRVFFPCVFFLSFSFATFPTFFPLFLFPFLGSPALSSGTPVWSHPFHNLPLDSPLCPCTLPFSSDAVSQVVKLQHMQLLTLG